ncbi:fluoride efflux transporter FluC [Streptomyces sp. NPDC020983]|uniref:fluoride efflux transporter FluC n=1 Tax=Streptomyces sp. NPDC020983 TaxID=3365106 RepID=UPI0037A0EE3A
MEQPPESRPAAAPHRAPGPLHGQGPVVGAVAAGGAAGACARYGASLLWPQPPDGFPWTTFGVNVTGCAVIGVLMVLVTELWTAHRLVRPFFGTGVLGGYTTFSTYAVEVRRLADAHQAATAAAYAGGTLAAAMGAVWASAWATRGVLAWRARWSP